MKQKFRKKETNRKSEEGLIGAGKVEESTEVNKHENDICTDVDDAPVPSRWKKTNFAV